MGWSVFGRTLYKQISFAEDDISMRDFVAWLKIVFTLMFYKCTAKSLFENTKDMYKALPMEWGLTKKNIFKCGRL